MEGTQKIETIENIGNVFNLPAVESFFNEQTLHQTWPESLTSNESFLSQIESRKKLQQILEQICNKLPKSDISLEAGIASGDLTETEVAEFYNSLTNLLESKQDYERIILYLPFEFLPDANWQAKADTLTEEKDRFKVSYVEAWRKLLEDHDVRANFIDGDVPEIDLRDGDLPRVVKAAHLLPILVKKGIIQINDVLEIMQNTEDSLLKQNIGEALLVMSDVGLIAEDKVPKDLPTVQHADTPKIITERRKDWLEEKKVQELTPPLEKPDINAPRLKGPFSKNLDSISDQMLKIKEILGSRENNEELLKLIYSVVMISGSRLKGYGTPNSDIDIGIFVKPSVSSQEQSDLQEKIKGAFSGVENLSQPVEFWLKENDKGLEIDNPEISSPLLGQSFQTQFLFGSVWEGDAETIRYLREKLLIPYFYDTDKRIGGRGARQAYLGELERETLQYRLMHKGYVKFFPPCGGIKTPHSNRIDSESMFWDSGFRQLATRLFAQRIFLPKIKNSDK